MILGDGRLKKYYIFDLDGTVVDSMPYWGRAMLELLDKYNIKYPPNVIEIIVPLGMKGTVEYFHSLGFEISLDDFMEEVYSALQKYYDNTILLKPYAREYLKKLKEKGASLNILTASPKSFVDAVLGREGVAGFFDNLWSCDYFGLGKTEPEIYYEVMKLLGATKEETVFFDDNPGSVGGAKKAGIETVAVFDLANKNFREELVKTADHHIESFGEFLEKEPF